VGAGRCFQQYNFQRPQFCAVVVCMVQLCLGSLLCKCFSWMAGLSWNVSLPVTKSPSVTGGKGWYIEEAAAFWEVDFHRLPGGVTEGKLFNHCTGGFWGWFFFFGTPSLFVPFFLFLFFPLKKRNVSSARFVHCPKAAVRQVAGREDVWPPRPALLKPCGTAQLKREKGPFSWFLQPFLGQGPCGCWWAWPKGNEHPQEIILWLVQIVGQAGGQAGEYGSPTPAQPFPCWSWSRTCKSAAGTNEWP